MDGSTEVAFKVTGVAMAVAPQPSSSSAASSSAGEKEPAAPPLKLEDLSLYSPPEQQKPAEPPAGPLEEQLAALRRSAQPYADRCRAAYGDFRPKMDAVVQFGRDVYAQVPEHSRKWYGRAAIIGLSGLVGYLVGRRSRLRKLLYPAGAMTVTASLYYPEQALTIAASAGDLAYEYALRGYAALEGMLNAQKEVKKKP